MVSDGAEYVKPKAVNPLLLKWFHTIIFACRQGRGGKDTSQSDLVRSAACSFLSILASDRGQCVIGFRRLHHVS